MPLSKAARAFVMSLVLGALPAQTPAPLPEMTVYKTKTCGCCGKWVEHMRTAGFKVTVNDVPSTAEYRQKAGVPDRLQSCHTALVGGYAIEGHIPAADILRLLKEKPQVKGIAVPGMPMGSPGMEGPRSDPYDVWAFQADGTATPFQHHSGDGK